MYIHFTFVLKDLLALRGETHRDSLYGFRRKVVFPVTRSSAPQPFPSPSCRKSRSFRRVYHPQFTTILGVSGMLPSPRLLFFLTLHNEVSPFPRPIIESFAVNRRRGGRTPPQHPSSAGVNPLSSPGEQKTRAGSSKLAAGPKFPAENVSRFYDARTWGRNPLPSGV